MFGRGPNLQSSPVALAFPHIQWDPLGSLRLTAQETALLRMAETNPIEYTLADSRDASLYARVLLKLLSEAAAAGAGFGKFFFLVSKVILWMSSTTIIRSMMSIFFYDDLASFHLFSFLI
jgi:hypothetical protein